MLSVVSKVRSRSRYCKIAFANRPESPCLTILEVRRPRSAGHILQKGATPNAQHLEGSRLERRDAARWVHGARMQVLIDAQDLPWPNVKDRLP
jgi:hypothetical protein